MVVTVGETDFEVSPVTLPTPLSIDKVVAPETEKDKVLDWPLVMEEGEAEKLLITGTEGGVEVPSKLEIKNG